MNRLEELASNRFCRICFVQDESENFSEILDTIGQMELLSVGNIEIFEGDGFPNLICQRCKIILSNAYKFKQNCKKSDTILKMYPMHGTIPPKINIPQESLPEFIKKPDPPKPKETTTIGTETDAEEKPELIETASQTDVIEEFSIDQMEMVISNQNESFSNTIIVPPPLLFEDEKQVIQANLKPKTAPIARTTKPTEVIKILNKSATSEKSPAKQFKKPSTLKIEKIERIMPTILNSQLPSISNEEQFFETIEETPDDGQIEIITLANNEEEEYLDEEVEEKEPVEMDKSEDGVVYTCFVCERSFPLLQQLEIHKQNHERARDHPCDYCDKAFFSKYDLAKHILTHTKQKDFTCVVCKKSFSRSTLLYRHEKIHTDPNIPRYQCEHCDRCYLNKKDYEKHQSTHAKSRPFACEYCDKKFAFKQGLERHEVIHDAMAMNHSCQYCNDRFKTATMLQRHLSSAHAGTRAFPCSKCSKRFMLSHHLYRHMRTSHCMEKEEIILQCPSCEINFQDREPFIDHIMEHAVDTKICPMCKFSSDQEEEICNHIELHAKSDMYFCDYCANIYMNENTLNDHFLESHSEELCSIGEEECQFVLEESVIEKTSAAAAAATAKRGRKPTTSEVPSKKLKKEIIVENEIEGASFVEYDEIADVEEMVEEVKKPELKKEEVSPAKPLRIKMSQREIKRLQKEGKITMQNGMLVMKN